ncbi:MAG: methyltransferase domain-containing protein [Candidatus Baltobacteraceae bacterium]
MTSSGGPVDFDAYAREHPYFDVALPPIPGLEDALRACHGSILEVGAGDGTRMRALLDTAAMAGFTEITLTDISAVRVARAAALIPAAKATVADGAQLPFADASFDFVFSDQVIEHVLDDRAMAREAYLVPRPGGRTVIGSVLKRKWAWYFYRNGGRWVLDPTHLREYTSTSSYAAIFADAGFCDVLVAVAALKFPLGDAALRLLIRLGLVTAEKSYGTYRNSRLLRWLARSQLRIPGYYGCWAFGRK